MTHEIAFARAIEASISYLKSEAARNSLIADPYWPKWDSPWWHICLLSEMGLESRIPRVAAERLLDSMSKHLRPLFYPEEFSETGLDPYRNAPCFCSMGNIYPILARLGLPVDEKLPWARKWMLRHELPDGGLNCHPDYYRAAHPGSSMVAIMGGLELFLLSPGGPRNEAEWGFVRRGVADLLRRKLRFAPYGTSNEEEKEDEEEWGRLAFPRFYFYDVLRGLRITLRYAELSGEKLPRVEVASVLGVLRAASERGEVRIGRDPTEEIRTLYRDANEWRLEPRKAASRFPLLDAVSRVGEVSSSLSRQVAETLESASRFVI